MSPVFQTEGAARDIGIKGIGNGKERVNRNQRQEVGGGVLEINAECLVIECFDADRVKRGLVLFGCLTVF